VNPVPAHRIARQRSPDGLADIAAAGPVAAPARPQDLLVTILGDYLLPGHGGISSGALVALLAELGASAPAARMALSRLCASQLIVRTRKGRTTHYRLTEHGRQVLEEGRERIFGFGQKPAWNGTWTLLMYTVPEQQRTLRHDLRKRLRFLGFTALQPATWIAPHDRTTDLRRLLDELAAEEHADIFLGRPAQPQRVAQAITESWELTQLEARYEHFLRRYDAGRAAPLPRSDHDAFVLRTSVMHSFRQFPLLDPALPDEFMDQPARRGQAVQLFRELWDDLAGQAQRYVEQTGYGSFAPESEHS
jgi:phenylacetic acid degradation operon negative regulatory protein